MQFLFLVNRIWTDVEVCHTHLIAVEADSTNNQTISSSIVVSLVSEWVEFNAPLDTKQVISEAE